jgi:hypothetical protein
MAKYHGLPYWDDKFNNYNLKTRLRNLLMMLWDCWLYKELKNPVTILKYTYENKNKTLPTRLAHSITQIKEIIGADHEWIYLTRIASDDMFHQEAVALIQSQQPTHKKALTFQNGYILNTNTGQVAEWNPPTNPPFHTIIFPANIFFDPQSHLEYYGSFKSHEDIPKVFDAETLDMGKYCVTFHQKHISTAWDSPIVKKAYYKAKYGKAEPYRTEPKGYCYTVSGRNISTRWESRARKIKNSMIGKEFSDASDILKDFGL